MSGAVSNKSLLRLGSLGLIWGSVFFFIKLAGFGFSPVQMVFLRLVLGALVLVPFVFARGLRLPAKASVWGHLLVAAFLGNALPWTLFAWGEHAGSSALAGVVNSTTPVWTVIVAFLIGNERRIGLPKGIGLALGIAGTLLIAAPWQAAGAGDTGPLIAFVVGTVSLGASFAYMGRFLAGRGTPPLVLAASQLLAASVIMLVALPFAGLQPIDLRLDSVLAILVLGPISTGAAYVLNFQLIAKDGPTVASTVTYLFPVVSSALGALFLNEAVTWAMVVGAVAALAGVTLVRRPPKPVTPAVPAAEPAKA
jgi:drug/metabolite transporter (DMT)-like permease